MAETINIAEVASKIAKDIFKAFGWHLHPRKDDNFKCLDETHTTRGGKEKNSHPTDVVFSYQDPYTGRRVHLLTDLKSYQKDSISNTKVRSALQSLAMSVECAQESDEWRQKFAVVVDEPHEIRGLLFVHNHDGGYEKNFVEELRKVNLRTLELRESVVLHFLGPGDISRLFIVANDILRLIAQDELPREYTFYYPDLVMTRRVGSVWGQQATVETIAGPFFIIKHAKAEQHDAGYLVYYNRSGGTYEEFEYLIDCFSRHQILDAELPVRIRVGARDVDENYQSNFDIAVNRYLRSWGFDETRSKNLKKINISRVQAVVSAYNPGDCGWRT
ncbi:MULTISPECIES: hypothetical protein [Xanthomonas]|uniref:GAPS4 PD-(D/E)XK nuclease domain-containing protein n=1 Tax=Xanthomonas sacchari TaxID=56458 RepID=A0A2P5YZZ6_9XANT|nr:MULTISPECIES: hypothetical protein [Xanthomonas]MDV0440321.1 hypothetical protein [Xanthomonas sacchari]PPU80564.1 hypothetical protein XsacCFBP4641_18135 [Xanthomonas sacchari]UYC11733.1 hypothetical protein NUG21_18600 [Xanthomonas sp. CFBP 8445]